MLECEKAKKCTLSIENRTGEWEEITEIYCKNKKKREVSVIQVQHLNKIIKESRKKNKLRKTKEKEKNRKIKGREEFGSSTEHHPFFKNFQTAKFF